MISFTARRKSSRECIEAGETIPKLDVHFVESHRTRWQKLLQGQVFIYVMNARQCVITVERCYSHFIVFIFFYFLYIYLFIFYMFIYLFNYFSIYCFFVRGPPSTTGPIVGTSFNSMVQSNLAIHLYSTNPRRCGPRVASTTRCSADSFRAE